MAITPAALASEINTDPAGLGYAALVAAGNDSAIAAALDQVRAGAAYQVFRNDVSLKDIILCIAAADFAAATQLQMSKLTFLFPSNTLLDLTVANTRTILSGIFAGASAATTNALAATAQRQGSRAEVLGGAGTVVSSDAVAKALRG